MLLQDDRPQNDAESNRQRRNLQKKDLLGKHGFDTLQQEESCEGWQTVCCRLDPGNS